MRTKETLGLAAALVLGLALTAQPAVAAPKGKASAAAEKAAELAPGAVAVSDYELNTFVFGDTVKNIFFPAGSPVLGTPIYLSDNTQVMLQFAKGIDRPIQMVVELQNGSVITLRVMPRDMPGVVHSVNGARVSRTGPVTSTPVRAAEPSGQAGRGASAQSADIELLKHVVTTGAAPDGFDPVVLPRLTRFDKFSVVPLSGWSDGATKRIYVFSLVAAEGQTAVVTPPQFYRPGITAVLIDGDVVDANASPSLYVVEELNDE